MINWDYQLPRGWKPKNEDEWKWFIIRKVNYNDLKGLTRGILKKYFPLIKGKLDAGKKLLLENYLDYHR